MVLSALGFFQKFLGRNPIPKFGSASVDSQVYALFRIKNGGKLLEYSDETSNYVYTTHGQYVRHPLGGAILGERCGVPDKAVHIIATHSFEGDRAFRTPEAFIVRNADSLNFLFLAFRFLLQMDHK
jgi:hypothetical protein